MSLHALHDRSSALLTVIAMVLVSGVAASPPAGAQGEITRLTGPELSNSFGTRVSGAGDMNQDGFADFAISNSSGNLVYSGVDRSILLPLPSGKMAEVGDADLDGVSDLTIHTGAHLLLFSGASGAQLWSVPGTFPSDLSSAGDFDGDGRADIVTASTSVVIHSGLDGSTLKTFAQAATLVRGGHDADLDGVFDLLLASLNPGVVDVVSGQTGATLASTPLVGNPSPGQVSVAFLDDIDGDLAADFAVGEAVAFSGAGRVRAFSGQSGAMIWQTVGNNQFARFGAKMVTIADVNKDSKADLLVNANVDLASTADTSSVSALSGATGAVVFKVFSTDAFDAYGHGMAAPGDINGDGRPDFVVGEPAGSWQQVNKGVAYVYTSHCWDQFVDIPGCPGSNGLNPDLGLAGCLTPTGSAFLQVTGTLGGAPGLLLVSPNTVSTPVGPGCKLTVDPAGSLMASFTTLGPAVAGFGSFSTQLQMPAGFNLPSVTLQAVVADPGTPLGVAVTNALVLDPN